MKQDLISVIVPVYNVEKYLEECINSIINQTYKNLEIILVDDGSKDNSSRICDELSKKDSRIRVIHKENGGVSDTRNVGILNSTGKYIQFADSDDFMEDNMIETLYKDIVESKAEVAMCSYYLFKNGIKTTDANYEKEIYNKEQILGEILLDEKIRSYAWNKLFKKNLFDEIQFPNGKVFEDIYIIPRVLEKSEKVVFNNTPLYYYRHRDNSISKIKSISRIESAINNSYLRYKQINKKIKDLKIYNINSMLNRICCEYFENQDYLENNIFFEKFSIIIKEILQEYFNNYSCINKLKLDYNIDLFIKEYNKYLER